MELIAHRGCGAVYPENTLRAVRRASDELPAVEVDVRRCGSGELVCVHDETVDRVTEADGPVADYTLAELGEISVQGSGEPIPSFEAVVAAIPAPVVLQVELKEPGIGDDALRVLGARGRVRLSSFEPAALRELRDREVPTGLLFRGDPADQLDRADALGCANVHPHWRDCTESAVVDRAHDRGFDVYAWGIETDGAALEGAQTAGADGARIDRPDLATA